MEEQLAELQIIEEQLIKQLKKQWDIEDINDSLYNIYMSYVEKLINNKPS